VFLKARLYKSEENDEEEENPKNKEFNIRKEKGKSARICSTI